MNKSILPQLVSEKMASKTRLHPKLVNMVKVVKVVKVANYHFYHLVEIGFISLDMILWPRQLGLVWFPHLLSDTHFHRGNSH